MSTEQKETPACIFSDARRTYRDAHGLPAVVQAFGWSHGRGSTMLILAMRSGRVELFRIDWDTFERSYHETNFTSEAGRLELDALARVHGANWDARRLLRLLREGDDWKVAAMEILIRLRNRVTSRPSVWDL